MTPTNEAINRAVSAELAAREAREYWSERIAGAWRESVEGILRVGQYLADAKEKMPLSEWQAMVDDDLPFNGATARKLMLIAGNRQLRSHGNILPPSWTTLYELSTLSPGQFIRGVKQGAIKPEMERRDVAPLKADPAKLARRAIAASAATREAERRLLIPGSQIVATKYRMPELPAPKVEPARLYAVALQTINDFAAKRTMLDVADAAVASDPAELEQAIGWLRRVHELALIRRARAA